MRLMHSLCAFAALSALAADQGAVSKTEPFDVVFPDEFASVTIVVDHLQTLTDKTVVKMVWATEAADEAFLSQVKYFGQTGLLLDDGVRAILANAEASECAIIYHVSDRETAIIVDLSVWTKVFGNPEMGKNSVLETCASFMAMAIDLQRAANAAEEPSTVLLFQAN